MVDRIFRGGLWIFIIIPALYVFARLWTHIIGHVLHGSRVPHGGVWIVVVAIGLYAFIRARRHNADEHDRPIQ